MKRWLLFFLLAALAAVSLYYWLGGGAAQALSEKSLTFADIRRTNMRDTVSATGHIEPVEIVVVTTKLPGTVTKIAHQIGDNVFEGAELALLDTRQIDLKVKEAENGIAQANAALVQAKSALAQAEAAKDAAAAFLEVQNQLARTAGLRTEREQAEAQHKAALAGVKVAEAGIAMAGAKIDGAKTSLRDAELARDMARVTVPGASLNLVKRSFLILDRKIHEGQAIGPQTGPLFTLAGSLESVELHALVVEGDINKVRAGLTAYFKVANYKMEDIEFTGTVVRKGWQASNIKGAVYYDTVIEVKKNLKDKATNEWLLRPGMTIEVDIVRVEHANVFRVPIKAMNFKLDDEYQTEAARAHVAKWKQRPDANDWYPVWTWDDARKEATPIMVRVNSTKQDEVGLRDDEGIEVLEWEPGKEPAGPLRVIIGAPPARPPGIFDQPANVKI